MIVQLSLQTGHMSRRRETHRVGEEVMRADAREERPAQSGVVHAQVDSHDAHRLGPHQLQEQLALLLCESPHRRVLVSASSFVANRRRSPKQQLSAAQLSWLTGACQAQGTRLTARHSASSLAAQASPRYARSLAARVTRELLTRTSRRRRECHSERLRARAVHLCLVRHISLSRLIRAQLSESSSISDDGGSSSEIQRILGGPSVGDLRSRLVRLIPDAAPGSPRFAIRRLLEYRLGDDAPPRSFSHTHAPGEDVRAEWRRILEGTHALWRGIPADRRECIRPFLVNADAALLRRAPASARPFNWHRASVGNLFITGAAQTLGGSIQAAILLFACMADIPHERLRVVPVINTPATATIGVQLADGSVVVGQSEISHPNPKAKDSGESLAVRPDSPFRPTSSRASSRSGAATVRPCPLLQEAVIC